MDVHTHLVPEFWAEELKSHGGDPSGWGQPAWSKESVLAFMEKAEISCSILSLTAPGIEGWSRAERPDIARRVNDYGAELVRSDPDRFGYLCTLPLPDIEASLAELKRCYDELSVDGVCLHSNYDGNYLGDPLYDPLWSELEARKATIFLHPTTPAGVKVLEGQPSPMEDYPADTTKVSLDLVTKGHMTRYPSVRIVLSHGGGFMPFVATRFAELGASITKGTSADHILAELRKFYFDTALVAPSGMPSLLAFAPADHIVFGTDFPYASEAVSLKFTENLDAFQGLDAETRTLIDKGAASLFPRLSSR
ncbi:amidohydrolase family protein [Sphingomonas sp. BK580]|uniref:amidohydrolase family protein n=1 Tax=Sphingomonas sp. BK580 TaxID=2586972 RepID=UPI0017C9A414|nr:amidohydrolase family protein [Sphingomonas sp. BK580]MBB3695162.1 aminocarboxymuconate-semialdehyde decarboxylase [Sphingomonas sp. BK580]